MFRLGQLFNSLAVFGILYALSLFQLDPLFQVEMLGFDMAKSSRRSEFHQRYDHYAQGGQQ